ncbi:MAG: metallophosphatase family protein [Candidatus Thermoplasmatota archaeon]|nr:metallophosphatase family protein [Candidatus Thermoplasmatota archaeon]MCL5730979.1 metallophosphatase family protein [Candidatus Thermoplasmatota archaeon]
MKVLIASDIHANLPAAKELQDKFEYDYGIFLGDIVDYGTRPVEVIDIIRSSFDVVIRGNHDNAVALGVDCSCSNENHDLSVYTRTFLTEKIVGKEEKNYLKGLPIDINLNLDGHSIHVSHAAPDDPLFGYLYPWDLSREVFDRFSEIEGDIFLSGHTHYPVYSQYRGRLFLNPGSSGQPRDKDSRPSVIIWETESDRITFERFDYDRDTLRSDLKENYRDNAMLERLIKLFRV